MRKSFDNQLSELNLEMIRMGAAIETSISNAADALMKKDIELANQAIMYDEVIDEMERDIERRCLKLLLQQQPVATDLRKISSALKIITDMERIGDQAADISEITKRIATQPYIKELVDIPEMAVATASMVKKSIDAYVNNDLELALSVMESDDVVDNLFGKVKDHLIEIISVDKSKGEQAIDLLMIAKYFERIGDHAVNISEWVEFAITGVHKNSKIM